ncbi:MAG: class II D-tagatose-bisphosphate aldolase, non-catalytic subunit [Pseudomonadota bacterium]
MPDVLRDIIARNRAGEVIAIPSICSAQPDVLAASLRMASRLGRPIVIEATSNQVNQYGGYTGMQPAHFVTYVHDIADDVGADRAGILFGGDHLGTQAWRSEPADAAMEKARTLVRSYAAAGFRKIHLDCSEGCAGESPQLDDAHTASRSADLAQLSAQEAEDLLFVVGTEVPPPGGAHADEESDIAATDPAAATATLAAHDEAFGALKDQIGGLVVQPGVEFSPTQVHHLPMDRDPGILQALGDHPSLCLEAHSTDYQHPTVFPRLAELGFAFQKVGPALTFAYRAALYALDQLRASKGALQNAMEEAMCADPSHWQSHYHGDAPALFEQRHFGLADRIRYYWPHPKAREAVAALMADLPDVLSDAQLASVFDEPVLERAERLPGSQAQRLIHAQIETALAPYFFEGAP